MIFTRKNSNKYKRPSWKKRKFVYSKKTYANPFFRHKRSAMSRTGISLSNKIKLSIFAAVVALLILIWLLIFSNLFKINKIEVSGVGENDAKTIQTLAQGLAENRLLGKNNLLLYNKTDLSRLLNEKYYLQNLSIQKKLFHTLKITLQERQQAAAWHEDDKYYFIDGNGNIINQVDPLNINRLSYPVIDNLTDLKIQDNRANVDPGTIGYVLNLYNEFKDKRHGFEVEKFILDKDISTVKLAMLDGPKIYFNTKESIAKQANELDLIIKVKLKDNFRTKEYIDLRYGNNIYTK
jgi:cell division septal protein FtsQ